MKGTGRETKISCGGMRWRKATSCVKLRSAYKIVFTLSAELAACCIPSCIKSLTNIQGAWACHGSPLILTLNNFFSAASLQPDSLELLDPAVLFAVNRK
jgi:hypothetical protein